MRPESRCSHLLRRFALEGIQDKVWQAGGRCDRMHVIGSGIDCAQHPAAKLASLKDRGIHGHTLRWIQFHRCMLEKTRIVMEPPLVRRNIRCVVSIVMAIHRAAFIAVQSGAIATERDEVG